MLRPTHAAAAAAGLFALAAAPNAANAQSPCGASYMIEPGDSLQHIAQKCRVSIGALLQANPSVANLDRLQVGWLLDIRPNDDVQQPGASTYVVQRGDTLGAIAQRHGINLRVLLDANPHVQPRQLEVGQVLSIPIDHPMLQAHLTPRSGEPGQYIRVEGEGFRPGSTVRVGAGPDEGEWNLLEDFRVDNQGRVNAHIQVPQWADHHDTIVFVVAGDYGREARTRFKIEGGAGSDPIDIRGEVTQGVECPILTTEDGRVYSLGSARNGDVRTGVYAHVEGEAADISFCQQGTPVEVSLFETLERDDAGLDRGYVFGSWVQRGGDCRTPNFAITGNDAGGQVVETSLEGDARTGYVRLGDDPAFIFDRPRREFPLEERRAGGLSVKPPPIGAMYLGGVKIEGDGVVFVRCAPEFVRN